MRRLVLLALALAATSLTITAVPSLAAKPEHSPPELQVPDGHRLVLSALGRGVQIYDCPAGAWALREPAAAILRGKRTVALHYAGPTWQSVKDGSKVVATGARVMVPRRIPNGTFPGCGWRPRGLDLACSGRSTTCSGWTPGAVWRPPTPAK